MTGEGSFRAGAAKTVRFGLRLRNAFHLFLCSPCSSNRQSDPKNAPRCKREFKSALIWPRKLGVSLIVLGAILVSAYVLPTVYGRAMSHVGIALFRAESRDHRMWDSARIRAYQRTLRMSFAPPEAVLRVPRVGIEVPVLEGTTDAIMNRGVGHIAGTALPGQTGNLAITGHRDGFFRPLKDIRTGDVIEVERPGGAGAAKVDRYVVRDTKVVVPSDVSVLAPTRDATLTLITCYPFYYIGSAPQRFVVQATLLPAAQLTAQGAAHSVPSFTGE